MIEAQLTKMKDSKKAKPKTLQKASTPPKDHVNLLEFILFKFDICFRSQEEQCQEKQIQDKDNLEELYHSFNQYFTREECSKALINGGDSL